MGKGTKRVSSGKYLDLENLTPDDIDIEDIDRSLNYIYRFTGSWKNKPPLTVAQHLRLCYFLSKEIYPGEPLVHLDCVLHDAAEYLTGDVATPLKRIFGPAFKAYEHGVELTVYQKLWTVKEPFTEEIYEKRKLVDLLSLDIERRAMWADQRGKDKWPDIPLSSWMDLRQKEALFDEMQDTRIVDYTGMYMEALNAANL